MQFPSTSDFVKQNSEFKLLDVMMLSGSEDGKIDTNLVSWVISSVEQTYLVIELEFERPLEVSQGEKPDQIVIQAGLD